MLVADALKIKVGIPKLVAEELTNPTVASPLSDVPVTSIASDPLTRRGDVATIDTLPFVPFDAGIMFSVNGAPDAVTCVSGIGEALTPASEMI